MGTLISVHNSSGCVGRCDAKCYNATMPKCECICGGANHGVGKSKAENNTRKMAEDIIEKNAEKMGYKSVQVFKQQKQLGLW